MNPADFCPRLIEMLASCGIALVFLPHIGGSFLHGATFYDGDKIVVGLTVRVKDADKFWLNKIAARWLAKAVAQLSFSQ